MVNKVKYNKNVLPIEYDIMLILEVFLALNDYLIN
jgi:hypothetical protein